MWTLTNPSSQKVGEIEFWVPQDPKSKMVGRTTGRFYTDKEGNTRLQLGVRKPQQNTVAEAVIQSAFYRCLELSGNVRPLEVLNRLPWTEDIRLRAYFCFPHTKETVDFMGYDKKPDDDNLRKNLGDALNKIAWVDDKQIVGTHMESIYFQRVGTCCVIEFWTKAVRPRAQRGKHVQSKHGA